MYFGFGRFYISKKYFLFILWSDSFARWWLCLVWLLLVWFGIFTDPMLLWPSWVSGREMVGGRARWYAPAVRKARLSAWISCQPVTHQVATHQPLTGRLTHLWERISESGEWCPGQESPPLLEQSLQLVTSHFSAIVYHPVLFYFCTDWHVAFVSFFTHGQWSLVNWS